MCLSIKWPPQMLHYTVSHLLSSYENIESPRLLHSFIEFSVVKQYFQSVFLLNGMFWYQCSCHFPFKRLLAGIVHLCMHLPALSVSCLASSLTGSSVVPSHGRSRPNHLVLSERGQDWDGPTHLRGAQWRPVVHADRLQRGHRWRRHLQVCGHLRRQWVSGHRQHEDLS